MRTGPRVALAPIAAVLLLLLSASIPVPGASGGRATPLPATAAGARGLFPLAGDWPTYLFDAARSSTNPIDRTLNTSNAGRLTLVWNFTTGGSVAASPIVVRGTVYIGSWDGYEYALNETTGAFQWATFLGKSVQPRCKPAALGITSTATWSNGTLYVGGGADYWYALDASNGSILWKVFTGNNSSYYNWGSPLIVGNDAYIGLASYCDSPLIRGALMEVGLVSHTVLRTFYTVPAGQRGGGIWSSPTYDGASNSIFVSTGNGGQGNQPNAPAVISVNATTLVEQGHWRVPKSQIRQDSDFGATPTLLPQPHGPTLVEAMNKDGLAYAFNAANVSAGPVWTVRVGNGGPCGACGSPDIESGAYANHTLFLASSHALVGTKNYSGSISALWPSNGTIRWRIGTSASIIPAPSYDDGLLAAGVGKTMRILNAATGATLFQYSTGGVLFGPAVFAHGCVFFGSTDYHVYALGLAGSNCSVPSHRPPIRSAESTVPIGGPRSGVALFAPIRSEDQRTAARTGSLSALHVGRRSR